MASSQARPIVDYLTAPAGGGCEHVACSDHEPVMFSQPGLLGDHPVIREANHCRKCGRWFSSEREPGLFDYQSRVDPFHRPRNGDWHGDPTEDSTDGEQYS